MECKRYQKHYSKAGEPEQVSGVLWSRSVAVERVSARPWLLLMCLEVPVRIQLSAGQHPWIAADQLVCVCRLPVDIICLQETKLRRPELTRDVAVADGWCECTHVLPCVYSSSTIVASCANGLTAGNLSGAVVSRELEPKPVILGWRRFAEQAQCPSAQKVVSLVWGSQTRQVRTVTTGGVRKGQIRSAGSHLAQQ